MARLCRASFSHSLIQDNVIYAYGCYYEAECNTGSAPYPFFFAPDGTYDIYDYRDPDELRIDAEAEAMLTGHIKTGAITQDIAAGGEIFLRSVQQPGFYTVQNPYDPNGIVQDGAVYTYVGSENIYQPIAPSAARHAEFARAHFSDPPARAAFGKTAIRLPPSCRTAFIFPAAFSSSPASRYDSLHDHNYSAYASLRRFLHRIIPRRHARRILRTSPSGCRNSPSPLTRSRTLTLYSNYGVLLSLGPQAPFWTDNGSQFLVPFFTRQAEVGAKYQPGQRILLTDRVLPHARAVLLSQDASGPDSFCPDGAPAINALSPKAAKRTTASNSTPKARPPAGCGSMLRPPP